MPIEIKELVVRATLTANNAGKAMPEDQAALVKACVDEVMERLKEQAER